MAENDNSQEKTEEPTPRRLEKAKEEYDRLCREDRVVMDKKKEKEKRQHHGQIFAQKNI